MEADPAQIQSNLQELSEKLWSRDAVLFNSTINANFASSAIYKGHGLEIKGASNVKHAAWLLNSLDSGPAAQIRPEDITWNDATFTATILSTRFLRPRLFPLFTFAFKVRSRITLHADGAGKRAHSKSGLEAIKDSGTLLYVTKWEDDWPLDAFVQSLPVVGSVERALFTPIVTAFVLVLSNLLFDLYARGTSVTRSVVKPTARVYADEARSRLPPGVTKNLDQGFSKGSNLASGWVKGALDLTSAVARPPLRSLEWAAQVSTKAANRISPVPLPTPFIYAVPKGKTNDAQPVPVGARSHVSAGQSSKARHDSDIRQAARGREGEKLNAASPTRSVRAFPDEAAADETASRDAVVRIGATADAPAREISIPSRINNEAPQEEKIISADPASGHKLASEKSLFERIEPAEIEKAEKAQKKAQSERDSNRRQPSRENLRKQPSSEKLKPKSSRETLKKQPSKESLKRQSSKENVSNKSAKASEGSSPNTNTQSAPASGISASASGQHLVPPSDNGSASQSRSHSGSVSSGEDEDDDAHSNTGAHHPGDAAKTERGSGRGKSKKGNRRGKHNKKKNGAGQTGNQGASAAAASNPRSG